MQFSLKLKKVSDQLKEAVPMNSDISDNVLIGANNYRIKSFSKDKKIIENCNNQIYSGSYIHIRESSQKKASRNQST